VSGGTAIGTLVINMATPAVTLASSLNPALTQNGVTLMASVSSSAGTPSGSVTFYSGTTPLGAAVTLNNGAATLITALLPIGTDSLTAVYSGDSNFAGATSGALAEVIEDFNLSIPSSVGGSETVTPGQSATFTLTLSPGGPATTFPVDVNFSVTGLPAGATYTITPTTLAAGSGTTTVTLVVATAQTTAANEKHDGDPRLPRRAIPVALGLLVFFGMGRLRKHGKNWRRIACAAILLLAGGAATLLSGCGGASGGSGSSSQTPQSYTITVTATAGNLQRSTNVTLTVQ
jgi:hypothetical protein